MNTLVKISGLLSILAAAVLLLLSSGCAGLGRAAQFGAGLAAPRYKASVDNLYQLFLDDQLAASLDVEVVLEDKEGRIYRKPDIRPVVLTSRRSYDWDSLPRGAWQRFLGETSRLSPEQQAQRNAFAEALKTIPSTPEKEKSK